MNSARNSGGDGAPESFGNRGCRRSKSADAGLAVRWPLKDGSGVLLDPDVYAHLAGKWSLYRQSAGSRRVIVVQRRKPWGKAERAMLDRVIMGAREGQWVVHLNGDVADCRRANMRLTTSRLEAGDRLKNLREMAELSDPLWLKHRTKVSRV